MTWARSNRRDAANRIEAIIDYMQRLGKRWDLPLEPDTYMYNAYLGALLKIRTPSIAEKAEGILFLITFPEGVRLSSSSNNMQNREKHDGMAIPRTTTLKREVKTFTRIMQCITTGGGEKCNWTDV